MHKIITPVITVLDQHEKPDHEASKKAIDFLANRGVGGTLVLGSTGELTGMDRQEKNDFFRFYAKYAVGRVELYAGTGGANSQGTMALSNRVCGMGYAGPMVIGPCYYGIDQEKLFIYYDILAKSVKGSLYIYNYPTRTEYPVAPFTMTRLLETSPNIAGLKNSVSEPSHTDLIYLAARGYFFDIYLGFDGQYLYNITSGRNGYVGGLPDPVPEVWNVLVRVTSDKDFRRPVELPGLIHELMFLYDLDSDFSLLFEKVMNHRELGIADRTIPLYNQMGDGIPQRTVKLVDQVLERFRALNSRQGQYS